MSIVSLPMNQLQSLYDAIMNHRPIHNHYHAHLPPNPNNSSSSNWRAPQNNNNPPPPYQPPPPQPPPPQEEDLYESAPLNKSITKKLNNKRLIGQRVTHADALKPHKKQESFNPLKYRGWPTDQIEKDREEYWMNEDLDNEWCLFCFYRTYSSKESQKQMPFVDTLHQFVNDYIGNMPDEKLIETLHTLFVSTVRDQLPQREIDPYTNKPCPPHWWYPTVIREHLLSHETNVVWERKRQYRNVCVISRNLEDVMMKKRISDDEYVFDTRIMNDYIKFTKVKFDLEHRLETIDPATRQK
jgi:hypothetical protein